ncbi:hypothetical protein F5X99DRAFT_418565 [Biscogniauxia marginata]|nr:hypothetical protein F5X99DRAFT_418565 [Biscogniauxia marginata]
MTEREDSDSSQPRKRIAVACGRCRKRKIRCSGDPGNGGPCSNCKNAGHEPCLFLRVSSHETQIRNEGSDYGYNLDAARTYANHPRGTASPLNPSAMYTAQMPPTDVLAPYRQNPYQYGGKGYYSTMSGWTGAYPDEEVDYGLNYPSYPMLNQDPAHMVQGYGRYGSGKSVYIDPHASSYSYGSLAHRPAAAAAAAVNNESQGFSLSSMAASLPTTSDRMVPSDRLHSQVNRTLTGSSNYRTDGLPSHYPSAKTAPPSTVSDVGYSGIHSNFEPPYTASSTLTSNISHRPASNTDGNAYPPSANTGTDAAVYTAGEQSLRPAEDSGSSLSYIYSDTKLERSRRGSHSSGGASSAPVLSNGHVYVPESSHHPHVSSQSYVVPGGPPSQGSRGDGATASAGGSSGSSSSSSGPSHMQPSDGHRRSAGSLRGG